MSHFIWDNVKSILGSSEKITIKSLIDTPTDEGKEAIKPKEEKH